MLKAAPARAKKREKPAAKTPARITLGMLEQIGDEVQWRGPTVTSRAQIFAPPKPAPGVVPKGMALDYGLPNAVAAYAAYGNFGEGVGFLGYPYLSELTQVAEYRRGSEIIATELTRKWLKLKAVGKDDKSERIRRLEDALDKFEIQDLFRRAAEHDGFFGIGHLYVDTGATDNPDELKTGLWLDPAKIGKGSLNGFRLIEPIWTQPNRYNADDPLRSDYYVPQTWFVMGKEVHRSRLLSFVAREVPDLLKPAYSFGGISLSQIGKPYVDNWRQTQRAVNRLIHSFSTMILGTTLDTLIQPGSLTSLINRLQLFNQTRDNRGIMAIDKMAEQVSNVSTPLSTLDQLQAQAQEHMAAVWKIPLVVLLGIEPAGLNNSSEGQIRTFYDWIGAQQRKLFDKNFRRVMDIIQLSEFGDIDPYIVHDWEPLWQMDAAGMAAMQKTKADTYAVLANECNAVSNEEIRTALAADVDSPFHGLQGEAPEPPDLGDNEEDTQEPTGGGDVPGETKAAEKSGV